MWTNRKSWWFRSGRSSTRNALLDWVFSILTYSLLSSMAQNYLTLLNAKFGAHQAVLRLGIGAFWTTTILSTFDGNWHTEYFVDRECLEGFKWFSSYGILNKFTNFNYRILFIDASNIHLPNIFPLAHRPTEIWTIWTSL